MQPVDVFVNPSISINASEEPMSSETLKPCKACEATCDHQFSAFCSNRCQSGWDAVTRLGDALVNLKPAPVKHVYFYDFAFGDLCDLFTTYLIRRVHTTDLHKQRVVDRALERVERAITTKLDKWSPVAPIRRKIASVLHGLYNANARIWYWKEDNFHTLKPGGSIDASVFNAFLEAYEIRDSARRELDRLLEGATMTEKTYERNEA